MSASARTATIARAAASAAPRSRTASGHVLAGCNVCGCPIAYPGAQVVTVLCPVCGTAVALRHVTGLMSEQACDSRCVYARGDDCECGCSGANHGVGHLVRPVPTWVPVPGAPIPVEFADQSRAARAGRAHAESKATARAQRAAEQRAARDRDRMTAAQHRTAEMLTDPAIAALMGDAYAGSDSDFVLDMRRKVRAGETLSPNMRAAVARMVGRDADRAERDRARRVEWAARDAAALAAGVRVPSGRVTFTGTVTGWRQDTAGPTGRTVLKITVTHPDGWRVYGTCPAAFAPRSYTAVTYRAWLDSLPGQQITLTATLEPKAGEPLFGWFSRPTLADPAAVTAAPAPARRPATLRPKTGTAAARPCAFHGPDTICPACGAAELATVHADRAAVAASWTARDTATGQAPADTFVSGWGALLNA